MQNTTINKYDYILRKLPFINMLFVIPFNVLICTISFGNPIIVFLIFSITSMSVMGTVYRLRVTDYKKNIDPKKFLVLSVTIAIFLFISMYFGFTALGWMDM